MAKKQKRQISQRTAPASVPASPTYTPPSARRVAPINEFKPDYTLVKADLKRIGILAGSFFGILIVLSFFLR